MECDKCVANGRKDGLRVCYAGHKPYTLRDGRLGCACNFRMAVKGMERVIHAAALAEKGRNP